MTDQAIARLRVAAALLASTPHLSVRLRDSDRTIVEAMRPPFPDRDHAIIPACGFRQAVARAHGLRRAGHHVAMAGIGAQRDPAIDLGSTSAAAVLSDGIVRVAGEARTAHFLAVCHHAEAVARIVDEIVVEAGWTVRLHADRELETTVVAVVSEASPVDVAESVAVVDMLRAVSARAAVAELEAVLNARVDDVGSIVV